MRNGHLKWLGPTPASRWRSNGGTPPSVDAPIEYATDPLVGGRFLFRDTARNKGVLTTDVMHVMHEGNVVFFSTENSRYKLTRG